MEPCLFFYGKRPKETAGLGGFGCVAEILGRLRVIVRCHAILLTYPATEINHAMAGEHVFDGFIKNFRKDEAKEIINSLLGRMNNGESVDPTEIERALGDHMA